MSRILSFPQVVALVLTLGLAVAGCSDDSEGPATDSSPDSGVDSAADGAGDTLADSGTDTTSSCPSYISLTEDFDTDTTLDGCYLVEDTLTVSSGATLTIAAGSVLVFLQDTGLNIASDGVLRAEGTAAAQILLTGEQQLRGFWRGIALHDSGSQLNLLQHVVIEFAGGYDFSYGEPANIALTSSGFPVHATIENCTLRQSAGYGFFFDKNAELAAFANNTISENAAGAGFVEDDAAGELEASSSFSGNDNDFVWVDADALTHSQTWPALDVPYSVDGALHVDQEPGIVLTIAPGANLIFRLEAGIHIGANGALKAQGNSAAPITFSRALPENNWRGISLHDSASAENVLQHVTIEGAGAYDFSYGEPANLALTSSGFPVRAEISHCTLRQSAGYGLFMDQRAELSSFANNTLSENALGAAFLEDDAAGQLEATSSFSGNTNDFVWVDADALAHSQTWPAIDVPYMIDGALYVDQAPGIVLTIAAGATLQFRPESGIHVGADGALKAEGTAGKPITFTWAVANTPWRGIGFHDTASADNILDHVVLEHAGGYDFSYGDPANLALTSSGFSVSLTLTNSTVRDSAAYGIWVDHQATLAESGNTFSGNTLTDIYYEPVP